MRRTALLSVGLIAWHFALPVAAGGASPSRRSAPATPNVSGKVLLTKQTHCGGARPRPDMPLSSQQPWSGKRFLVRSGSENTASKPVAEVVTDKEGRFSLSLPAGKYCLVREERRSLKVPANTDKSRVDVKCLENEQRTCDAVIDVTAGQQVEAPVEIYQGCFGNCYIGPMPP